MANPPPGQRFIQPIRELFIAYWFPSSSWTQYPFAGVPESPPEVAWHGPAPRLYSPDDGRYAHFDEPGYAGLGPTACIELPAGLDYTNAIVHARFYNAGEAWPILFITDGDAYGRTNSYEQPVTPLPGGQWHTISYPLLEWLGPPLDPSRRVLAGIEPLWWSPESPVWQLDWLAVSLPGADGILAIDTHDHPFHVVGTRDPAMPYELVIDTGTERLVEIVAGEEHLATHELVVDETGRPGTPWSHAGLFRPI